MDTYTIKKATDKPENSTKEIELEISIEEIANHRKSALKSLMEQADLPGFRKGHVPENVIIERLGETGILEEAINSWLKKNVPIIIEKEAADAIALPRVNITKAVPGNPVGLSLVIPLRPKLKLPDYKKISAEKNKKREPKHIVEEKEIDDAITRLRKYATKAVNPKLDMEPKEEELPPLNDQFAESIGGGKTVAELKERVKKDLENENQIKGKEKHRLGIIDEILKKTEGAIPDVIVHYEIEKMEAEFEADIKRMGLSFDDYLKNAKKTHEDLHKDWHPVAEKRAKVNLILAEIKKTEKLEVSKEKLEEESKHILDHYKEADPEQVKIYVERMLGNEKVFEFLESL